MVGKLIYIMAAISVIHISIPFNLFFLVYLINFIKTNSQTPPLFRCTYVYILVDINSL
jgi:hypothetical protein